MLLFSDLIEVPPVVSVRGVNDWGLVVSTIGRVKAQTDSVANKFCTQSRVGVSPS